MIRKLLYITVFLLSSFAFSQDYGSIQGRILDEEMLGEPLFFAEVSLENSTFSTQTNFHGNFELSEVTPGNYTLLVNYLGYETLKVPVVVKENEMLEIIGGLKAKSVEIDMVSASATASE